LLYVRDKLCIEGLCCEELHALDSWFENSVNNADVQVSVFAKCEAEVVNIGNGADLTAIDLSSFQTFRKIAALDQR
jgi:hypothetical protein